MNEKSSYIDRFAAIATARSENKRDGMAIPAFLARPLEHLPLTMGARQTPRPVAPKIRTEDELKSALAALRERMQPFLADQAPGIPVTRDIHPMDHFQWRVETPEDRGGFLSVLNGGGSWEDVRIPHYGPPLGPASTLYRSAFDLPESLFSKDRQILCFDAVDYRCQVYLNGVCLGTHEGFFDAFEFDATGVAQRSGNVLVVRVENDFTMLGQAFSDGDTDGDKIYAATGLGYDDPEEGWHHCPPGMGIWQGVRFESRARLAIVDLFVRPLPSLDAVEIQVEVHNYGPNAQEEVGLLVSIHGQNFSAQVHHEHFHRGAGLWVRGFGDLDHGTPESEPTMMGPGVNYLSVTLPIEDAKRWDLETPWLYQAQVRLVDAERVVLDATKRQFGMRSFVQDEQSTPKGKFRLNGREIRLRGANTMGNLDMAVFRGDTAQLHDDILIAKLTHMNFLRLTQHPVQREVYEACDRLGLMLQTDMPLFGSIRRNQFHECVRQSAAMERLVRSHPSSILVSFINEPFPAARAKPHRFMERDEMELFFDVASKAVRRENPDRVIKCVDGDYDPPAPEGMQDNHCYCGWYIGHGIDLGSLHHGNWMPVKSGWHFGCGEFGSEGLDSMDVMTESYPKEWLPTGDDAPWTPAAIIKAQSMNFHYLWYPTPHSVDDWIEASQRHQEWITRLMTESFRRLPGMNTFAIHLFIDAWPAGWMKTIMDVKRIPKRAWFAYRDVLTPLALSLRTDRTAAFSGECIDVELWLVNDLDEVPAGCMLEYEVFHEGTSLASGSWPATPVRCAPASQGVISIEVPEVSHRGEIMVAATLVGANGEALHDTELSLTAFAQPPSASCEIAVHGADPNAADFLIDLGISRHSGDLADADVILITDITAYEHSRAVIDRAVRDGATALLLNLPPATYQLGGATIAVCPAGMGPRHFVSCDSGHPMVEGFGREDFKFWFDEEKGCASPILNTVLEAEGWTLILLSGDGGWSRPWGPVPAAAERAEGKGLWRVCQVELLNRLKTNPAAKLFASRMLEAPAKSPALAPRRAPAASSAVAMQS